MNPKKQLIINAAYTLFINKGYNATSIQDILDEAGISKGTFYNYFTSKTECLTAIMESIASEIRQKRLAAATGKPADDLEVLAEQLCIRIRLNREKNLFSLYESIFYSQDEELKNFARNTYAAELNWISSRITDVFGADAKQFALENAAVVHGSIQQLIQVWKLTSEEELPTKELSSFVIRRLKNAVTNQMRTGDTLIGKAVLPALEKDIKISRETVLENLESYAKAMKGNPKIQELLVFLTEEFNSKNPRSALLESVLSTLASETSLEADLSHLLEQAWLLLPQPK